MKRFVFLAVLAMIVCSCVFAGDQESISSFPRYLEGVTPRGGTTWNRMFEMLLKKETTVFSYPYQVAATGAMTIPATPSYVIITASSSTNVNAVTFATTGAKDGQIRFMVNLDGDTTSGDIALLQNQVAILMYCNSGWRKIAQAGVTLGANAFVGNQTITGNLGVSGITTIGTTTAGVQNLNVYDNDGSTGQRITNASSTGYGILQFVNDGGSEAYVGKNGSAYSSGLGTDAMEIYNASGKVIGCLQGNTLIWRVNPSGEYQIGTSTDMGAYVFQVNGAQIASSVTSAFIASDSSPGITATIGLYGDGSASHTLIIKDGIIASYFTGF